MDIEQEKIRSMEKEEKPILKYIFIRNVEMEK